MENPGLFQDVGGRLWTKRDVLKRLRDIGAEDCEILFIHTDLLFGRPDRKLGRKGYLQALYQVLLELNVPTLVFPAFSYSFANHEVFDVRHSPTRMGALIEYIRLQPGVCRSLDPILSLLVLGKRKDLAGGGTVGHSFGANSGFDRLHQAGEVKFLFFGAEFAECFTYIHYIEKVLEVPYRFDMPFTGTIIGYDGTPFSHTQAIHTQCGGVVLKSTAFLKKELAADGFLKIQRLGDGEAACIAERDVFREVTERIHKNPFTLVEPYAQSDLTHEYTFGRNGERVTHC